MNHQAGRLHRRLAVGLLLIALALAAGALVISGAGAQGDPVRIWPASQSEPVGASATVDLQALSITVPKLGAWQIDIVYSPTVLGVQTCTNMAGNAACNLTFAPNKVRLVGASSAGLSGSTIGLATLGFKCLFPGVSPLTLTVNQFADTDGIPFGYSTQDGSIQCSGSGSGSPAVGGVASLTGVSSGALRSETSSDRGMEFMIVVASVVSAVGVSVWFLSRRRRID